MTLDNLAKEYKMLPSEALSRATTFDLYVLDVGTRWVNYKQEIADGKITPKKKGLTTNDLQQYMALAKKAHAERVVDENKK